MNKLDVYEEFYEIAEKSSQALRIIGKINARLQSQTDPKKILSQLERERKVLNIISNGGKRALVYLGKERNSSVVNNFVLKIELELAEILREGLGALEKIIQRNENFRAIFSKSVISDHYNNFRAELMVEQGFVKSINSSIEASAKRASNLVITYFKEVLEQLKSSANKHSSIKRIKRKEAVILGGIMAMKILARFDGESESVLIKFLKDSRTSIRGLEFDDNTIFTGFLLGSVLHVIVCLAIYMNSRETKA